MIRLNKSPVPQVILDHGDEWTRKWVSHVNGKTEITEADKTRYRHPEIETTLVDETSEKCAYCESKVTHVYPGDVEHILPKRKRPELFVDWGNLTMACSICNKAKGDYYEDANPLLNPYSDEPGDHLRFHGPLLLHVCGSRKGELTIRRLGLSRTQLIERRTESIRPIKEFLDRWHAEEPGPLKDVLLTTIRELLSSGNEHAATLRAFAEAHAGIGL